MTDTNVTQLIINKLTKAQYDALQDKSETELYLVPDEIDDTPTSGSENPVTSDGIKTALDAKQDTLVSGTNIKTINGNSILGSGDLDVKDVFFAEYGVTDPQDAWNAAQAGKIVIVERSNLYYYPESKLNNDTAIRFLGLGYPNTFNFFDLTTTKWGNVINYYWVNANNKVSTIIGNIDNTKFPTTKAVADYVSDIVGNINTILETI